MSGAVSTCNARAIFNIRCVNIWWQEHMNVISKATRFTSIFFRDKIRPCVPFGRTHTYALIPSNGLPSGMRALKGWLLLKVPFWVIIPCLHRGVVIMERIFAKNHGGPKCTSVVPFEILHSEEPFEVAVLSTSVWNDPSIWLNDPNGNMTRDCFHSEVPFRGRYI